MRSVSPGDRAGCTAADGRAVPRPDRSRCSRPVPAGGRPQRGVARAGLRLLRDRARAGDELVACGGCVEADDGPGPVHPGASQGFDAVVAVLEHQLAIGVRGDHRWGLVAVLDAPGEVVDVVAPLVFGEGFQRRGAWRAGETVELPERHLDRAQPPARRIGELRGQLRVVASRARQEVGDPLAQLVTFGGCSSGFGRVLLACAHGRSATRWRQTEPPAVGRPVGPEVAGPTGGWPRCTSGASNSRPVARAPTRSGPCWSGAGARWWRDRGCRAAAASTP